jgi:MFS family permease
MLTLVNSTGYSLLIPTLPFLMEKYQETELVYGLLIAVYAFSQFLGAPLMGALSDKYGRKNILLLSQLGTLLSWFIFAGAFFIDSQLRIFISLPVIVMLFSRITDGITGGNVSVTYAYVSDLCKSKERTRIFGTIAGLNGLGFMIGPWIGGVTSGMKYGYQTPILFAIIFSFITLLFIAFFLPESLPKEKRHNNPLSLKREMNIIKKFLGYRTNHFIKKIFLMKIFWTFAFTSFTTCFGLYAKNELNLNVVEIGNLFPIVGVFSVFNQFVIVKKIVPYLGNSISFKYALIIMAIGILMLSLNPNYLGFVLIIYIINLGFSVLITTTKTLVTMAVSQQKQGEISGLDEAILSINMSIAPIFATIAYTVLNSSTSFAIFGMIALIPAIIVLWKKPLLE